MEKELFKIFWQNVKSTYPEGTSKHTNAILEEDFEKVWSEILDLISVRKTEEKLKEVFESNEPVRRSFSQGDKVKIETEDFGTIYGEFHRYGASRFGAIIFVNGVMRFVDEKSLTVCVYNQLWTK